MCGRVLFLKIFIHESSLEALPCLAHNYAKIYKVRVLSVNIDEDGITYWLITVGGEQPLT